MHYSRALWKWESKNLIHLNPVMIVIRGNAWFKSQVAVGHDAFKLTYSKAIFKKWVPQIVYSFKGHTIRSIV